MKSAGSTSNKKTITMKKISDATDLTTIEAQPAARPASILSLESLI